eukprot:11871553-Alexandrium_andersonii.AAC.1
MDAARCGPLPSLCGPATFPWAGAGPAAGPGHLWGRGHFLTGRLRRSPRARAATPRGGPARVHPVPRRL